MKNSLVHGISKAFTHDNVGEIASLKEAQRFLVASAAQWAEAQLYSMHRGVPRKQ